MQTMQQRRAHFALTEVVKAVNNRDTNPDEYRSYAASFPAMIHINGLGQAAAFFKSKGGTHDLLYQLLSDWLIREGQPYHKENDLMSGIINQDMHCYRLAQAEAQAFLDWVTKFAKAYMPEKKTQEEL
ncbi:MAG: type III-B CRISPR module-associated protein Cmr5 [Gammaproteobacteria bacterium]|nr:type III-B CRISPR module-associated protein Cmr5 [Gammaproteobacteria bacterium]